MTRILAIETSCDETAAAVVKDNTVLSNIVWSQATLHSKFGGVYPSLAKRAHKERIDWVVEKAINRSKVNYNKLSAIAVTAGPGLAVSLEVGIAKAIGLASKHNKPLITVNHVEGHLMSIFAKPNSKKNIARKANFPLLALIASGKHTDLVMVRKIGKHKIVAHTIDDAIGEALDKAARMLGLGYPGGEILEKFAKEGDPNSYSLPIPMIGKEDRMAFSYSGLKTAMYKLVEKEKPLTKTKIADLAASFQNKTFTHVERIVEKALIMHKTDDLLFGGGVSSNIELRERLRKLGKKYDVKLSTPYTKKLCTDNAAMIGIVAQEKYKKGMYIKANQFEKVDRIPRAKIDQLFPWEK